MDQQGYGQQPPPQGYGPQGYQHPQPQWTPQQQPPKKSWVKRLLVLFGAAILVLIVGVIGIAFLASTASKAGEAAKGQLHAAANAHVDTIKAQVLKDSVDQYNLVKQTGGSPIQLCTQASVAYQAAVQANDETAVRAWQWAQKQDCTAAGMPMQ